MNLDEFLGFLYPLLRGDLTDIQATSLYIYLLASVLMFLNSSIMVPPSEYICLSLGVLAAHDEIDLALAIFLASVSNLGGTSIWYYIGLYHKGRSKTIASDGVKHSGSVREKIRHLYTGKLLAIEELYLARGGWVLFLLRNVPVLRSIASYPAGRIRMPLVAFLVPSVFGIALWVILWSFLGFGLGALVIAYKWQIGLAAGGVSLLILKLVLSNLGSSLFQR